MSITALVVDDEPIARRAILRLLRDDPDIELLGECGDGASAFEAIRHQSPELVFLDIQMPAMSGMEVVATIGAERMPATVFVTAFEQYAVRAFEANAVDYLVKPFSRERFAATLRRVKSRLSVGEGAGKGASMQILQALQALRQRDDHIERIPIRTGEHIHFIDVGDIVWIKANGNTVQIHLVDGVHEMRETMSTLVERLDPRHFARVHRSAIINVRRIKAIHPWFNGYHVVIMDTGQKLRMSRYQHDTFCAWFRRAVAQPGSRGASKSAVVPGFPTDWVLSQFCSVVGRHGKYRARGLQPRSNSVPPPTAAACGSQSGSLGTRWRRAAA